MASDDVGLSPVSFHGNPLHKKITKEDQLPISGVITGLPRPYHNNTHRYLVNAVRGRKTGSNNSSNIEFHAVVQLDPSFSTGKNIVSTRNTVFLPINY